MIKINIVQDFVNPNEELTKDKCLERIRSIKSTIRQTRSNVYGLFLGLAALKYAGFLLLGSIALAWIFKVNFLLLLAAGEITVYFIFAILFSEYLSKKLKRSLLIQLEILQKKLTTLN
ncbi:MAG: hypothetical protein KHY88_06190 [Erysipelotrichaceae bacterium]|nr:hypothetical protein [Erysipelotrichaceae bacterium]